MTDITLEALKLRERELELDAVLIRGRTLEIRQMIEEAQRRRGGRPRKGSQITVVPQRGVGGVAETETDEQGELPSIEEVRGILKEPEETTA
jgi:hypothetical protein